MRRSLVFCALLLALPFCAGAEPAASPEASGEVLNVKGYPSSGSFTLEIVPGAAATEAIRVYSEPSQTLLTVVEDADFAETEQGKYWHSKVFAENPRSASKTRLPDGRARHLIEPPPAGDDRIVAWVYGTWQDGKVEDRRVGEKTVGSGGFEISLAAKNGGATTAAKGGE